MSVSSTFIRRTLPCAGAALVITAAAGCLSPPPESQTPAAAAAPAGAAPEASPTPAAPSAPAASGSKEVIWDGDEVTRGQSWADCDKKPDCKATFAPLPAGGANGSNGLQLHAEGPGWQGGGWNWFGWWPENAGTDLSVYDDLTFSVKMIAPAKEKAPGASAITLTFGCSLNKKTSADVSLGKFAANATDGQWHEVRVPLKEFFAGKGAECDARTAWEFRVSSWSATPVDFTLVLDDIRAVKN